MNGVKKSGLMISRALAALLFFGWGVPSSDAEEMASAHQGVEYLYVQTAHAVTFEGNEMTLHGVSPTTLFFSDRPERIAGHGATTEVVQDWADGKDSFKKDPPNATLSILEVGDAEVEDLVVVLRNPRLKGDQLTYAIQVLDGTIPEHGGASALFIDIIGRPLTPVSMAGAARRTGRRVVRRNEVLR